MRVTDVILTQEHISKTNDGSGLAVGMADGYEYLNGKKTENQTHKKVDAVFPSNGYEKVTIKVMGTKHPLTPELIAQNGGAVKVRFKNLRGKFYRTSSGEYALSCTADAVEVVA